MPLPGELHCADAAHCKRAEFEFVRHDGQPVIHAAAFRLGPESMSFLQNGCVARFLRQGDAPVKPKLRFPERPTQRTLRRSINFNSRTKTKTRRHSAQPV